MLIAMDFLFAPTRKPSLIGFKGNPKISGFRLREPWRGFIGIGDFAGEISRLRSK